MKNGVYLIVDTEFTGQHPEKHGLIQIAMLCLDARFETLDSYESFVRPPAEVELDPESMAVNGITAEQIASGLSYNALCLEIIAFLKKNFDGKAITIGQFYPAEFMYLNNVFGRCGYDRLLMDELLGNDFIDTKVLANWANAKARLNDHPLPFPKTSLSKPGGLKDTFGISPDKYTSHTAMGDVLATLEVIKQFLTKD
jgi:DNA polymerase III epsilon subunit-like protein